VIVWDILVRDEMKKEQNESSYIKRITNFVSCPLDMINDYRPNDKTEG
jgi:hypothetical protein